MRDFSPPSSPSRLGTSSGYSPTGPEIDPAVLSPCTPCLLQSCHASRMPPPFPQPYLDSDVCPPLFSCPASPSTPPPPTPLTPRQPQALLDQFFNQMPKGGDIHLHYSGGIYTEVLIASALQYDMKLCEVGGDDMEAVGL